MDIVFMGSPDFASPSLEKLDECEKINIKGVVTQPDRKKGRGQNYKPTPVKEKAMELGLKVYEESNVNNDKFLNQLNQLNLDAIVVVAFGQKLSKKLLNIPEFGCINVHASLLPKYRGASPIHYSIVNGDNETGITIMYMEEELDTGDIISQKKVEIDKEDTVGTLHDKLAENGANLLVKSLIDIENDKAERRSQDDSLASYATKLNKNFGEIDWDKLAFEIYNLVRGVNPWPGAYTYVEDNLLKIWWVSIENENKKEYDPGTVVKADQESGLIVQTGKGLIKVDRLQLEGRKKMSSEAFLRGHKLKEGEKLE